MNLEKPAWPAMLMCALLAAVLQAPVAGAAEVTARVDRNRVVEGETVTLILQTDSAQQSLETDFSILGQDFEILNRRSESQMSIVNGEQMTVIRVLLTLEPRRAGQLVIPPLQFDGARTAPISIDVEAAPELAPGEAEPVFIEMSVDPAQGPHYVHAQLALTIRIYYQQNLTEAAINPPAPQQASVRLLDEIPFQADRNGVRYRVLERRYAIFPERSGELQIPPLQLTGRLIERPADRLWQPSVRGRRVQVESDPLIITVQPRPDGYSGQHWLPARRMTISQQLSDADTLHVGEPVTRSVIVDAVGLEENMIEEPGWPPLPNARIYPDQPQGITRDDGQWVLGHKEFRYAVVPEQPGELVLPEIRLDWWDTVADRQRTAVLPEHRVKVASTELVPAAAIPAGTAEPGLAVDTGSGEDAAAGAGHWRILTAVFAMLWLLTLIAYLRKAPPLGVVKRSAIEIPEDESALMKQIRRSCSDGDAARVRPLLQRWVRLHGPEQAHGSIMEFAAGVQDSALRSAIHDFDAEGFSPSATGGWNGRQFWKAFENWHQSQATPGGNETLSEPDLYRPARR